MRNLRVPRHKALVLLTLIATCLLNFACAKKTFVAGHAREQLSKTFSGTLSSAGGGGGTFEGEGIRHIVAGQAEANPTTRKIIRNGSLELLVSDVGQASNRIGEIVAGMGGFVEKSALTNIGGRTATITARVPASNLDRLMIEIRKVAVSVDRENLEARDVTREYIDLDARLRNAQAEEQQYLQILKRATTIKETLEGAEKLSNVRGRIEQLQGEMNYLTTQIDMSSLEISLHSEADATVMGIHWRPLRQAKGAIVDMISGLTDWVDSVVAFLINLPLIAVRLASILALIAVAVRLVRFLWKKLLPDTNWRLPWLRSKSTQPRSST